MDKSIKGSFETFVSNEICEEECFKTFCEQEYKDCDDFCYSKEPHFEWFYPLYKIKQKLAGGLWGFADGALTSAIILSKWGGKGGFMMGGLTQIISMVWGPIMGGVGFGIAGLVSDRFRMRNILNDYRNSLGVGGLTPLSQTTTAQTKVCSSPVDT